MNISQWLNYAAGYLAGRCAGAGRVDAEALLGHCTGRDRAALYRDGPDRLSPGQEETFRRLLERRAGGEPLAYITGHKEFMGLDFLVGPAVLIPRPETELLVEKALEILKDLPAPVVADVGTGSGAIAVSLAVFLESARIYATDISPGALEVARENAARNGVLERVEFRRGDLLEPLLDIPGFKADLAAANLPYVPSSEIPGLMPEVRDHEPREALDGGPDGLDHYRRLVPQARELLRDGGRLLMEIAPGQGAALREILGPGWRVEVFPDLAGRERLVKAEKMN
ncbi:MAG: peptide chain release factor N(5)-glutamine methyltransferase [Peptococcaceae bacterium]|nr:peptide chain release factor N(5)-glutamine methyltransferase [Peptococcaceae bacterium]